MSLRSDWEDVKVHVMMSCVKSNSLRDPSLKRKFVATGQRKLVEGLPANEKFWGTRGGRER